MHGCKIKILIYWFTLTFKFASIILMSSIIRIKLKNALIDFFKYFVVTCVVEIGQ